MVRRTASAKSVKSQKSGYNKFIKNVNSNPNFQKEFRELQTNPTIADYNKLFGSKITKESSLSGALRRMKSGLDKFGTTMQKDSMYVYNPVTKKDESKLLNASKNIGNKLDLEKLVKNKKTGKMENKWKFSNPKFKKRVKSLISKDVSVKEAIDKAAIISKGKGAGTHNLKVGVKSKKTKKKGKKGKKTPKKYRNKKVTIGVEELRKSNEEYE